MKTTPLHFAIALLALAMGARCSLTGGEEPIPGTGTISVTVTSGEGSPIIAAAVVILNGPIERTAVGTVGGTMTFTDLPPGTYNVGVTVSSFIGCDVVHASVEAGETTTVNITCTRKIGTITGTVSSGGMPISGAVVRLTGPGSEPMVTTGPDGAFRFDAVVGDYTLITIHQGFDCPVRTVMIEPFQMTTADISCAPKTTGSITGKVVVGTDDGFGIPFLLVTMTGPANLTTTTNILGQFAFDDLTRGTYTLAAIVSGGDCLASADVQSAQTTTVFVRCTFRHPTGTEIEGSWWYSRRLDSPTGSCPPPLPESGTGSMTFDSSNNKIGIIGLDPELTIVGTYDKNSGSYTGSGRALLGDGSSIQTDVTAYFGWSELNGPLDFYVSEGMSRRHRDSNGNLVCTETYRVGGEHFLPWDY